MQCSTEQFTAVQSRAAQNSLVQYKAVQSKAVLFIAEQYKAEPFSTVKSTAEPSSSVQGRWQFRSGQSSAGQMTELTLTPVEQTHQSGAWLVSIDLGFPSFNDPQMSSSRNKGKMYVWTQQDWVKSYGNINCLLNWLFCLVDRLVYTRRRVAPIPPPFLATIHKSLAEFCLSNFY